MADIKHVMTDDMLAVCDGFETDMEKECIYCLEKLKESNRAGDISLPHVNERGVNVHHGARRVMHDISEYWYQRMSGARKFVSREFADNHQLWDRNIK